MKFQNGDIIRIKAGCYLDNNLCYLFWDEKEKRPLLIGITCKEGPPITKYECRRFNIPIEFVGWHYFYWRECNLEPYAYRNGVKVT